MSASPVGSADPAVGSSRQGLWWRVMHAWTPPALPQQGRPGAITPPEVFQLFAYCTWSPDGREAPEGFAEIKDNRIWLRDLGWTGWGCMPAFTAPCGGKGGGGCLYQASPLHDFGNGQLYSKPAARPSPGKLSRDGHPSHRQLLLPWRQATISFVLHVPKASTQFCGQKHSRHCSSAGAQQEPGSSLVPTSMGRGAVTKPPPLSVSPFSITESAVASKHHRMDFSGTWKAECHAGSLSPQH